MPGEEQELKQLIASEKHLEGPLLPVLHALQNRYGFIPEDSIPLIADALRITRADVVGVISFYSYFRRTPPGRHVIQLCRAEACQARGSRMLEEHVKARLGVDFHETSVVDEISLEPVYCLGNCAIGPNLMLDDTVIGKVDSDRFDQLLTALREADCSRRNGANP